MKTTYNSIRIIIGIIYVVFFFYVLFFAYFRVGTFTDVNLIPFKSISQSLRPILYGEPSRAYILYVILSVLGNFLLLLPAPILFKLDFKPLTKWLFVLLVPIIIELIQFLAQVGSADVDDVLLNAAGALLGFWLRKKRI